MGTLADIRDRLGEGITPSELIAKGYAKSSVYKARGTRLGWAKRPKPLSVQELTTELRRLEQMVVEQLSFIKCFCDAILSVQDPNVQEMVSSNQRSTYFSQKQIHWQQEKLNDLVHRSRK